MNESEWKNCRRDTKKLLVLLAGQSNMAGRGYAGPDDLRPLPRVMMIRPDFKWQPAIEPITKDREFIGTFQASGEKIVSSDPFETVLPEGDQKVVGVGLGRTFGHLLAEANPGRTVGLIPCAVGGTSIAAWMPGGADDHDPNNFPYDTAIKKAREAQKTGKIVAILWHQGENDAKYQTPDYTEKLRTVIRNFRRDLNLGNDVPFIAGDMASFYPERIGAHIDIVDQALAELTEEDSCFRFVHTKDLVHRGDNLHYDTDSLHELGRRYFEAYRQFIANPEITIFADAESVIGEGPFYARKENIVYWVNPRSNQHPDVMPGCILRKTGPGIQGFEGFNPGIGTVSAFSQKQDGTFLLFAQGCKVWTWKPGEEAVFFAGLDGNKYKFNDVTTAPDGHVFCTVLPEEMDNGTGELWKLAPDGTFQKIDICHGIPNGMGFSPDLSKFYFTASTEGIIYQYRYENGCLFDKKIFARHISCDGLAVDTLGGVWSAGWLEKIRRFDAAGNLSLEVRLPGMIISSLCFGGLDWKDIYMTTASYPYDRTKFFRNHSGCVLVWKNSPYQGMKIPFFGRGLSGQEAEL